MKKLFCLILCLIVTFSSVSVFAQGYEIEKNALSPLEAFTQKLTQLTKEYDSDNETAVFSACSEDETELAHKDSTKRLIVKAEGKIDTLNAVEHIDGFNNLHILQFASYEDMENALSYYEDCENVIYAQEDCINKTAEYEIDEENIEYDVTIDNVFSSNAVANPMEDCSYPHGFTGLRQKIADRNIVYTEELTVAVIDTGVEADHELLAGRVKPTGFDSVDGVSCADKDGHGTHVAGIIVANTLDNVTVKPYRVLDENGEGSDAQVVLGIEAAIADGVDVINMSLGRRGTSEIMDEAVKKANDAGIIVVVAAGNDGANMNVVPYTPACCDNVITVKACMKNLSSHPSWTNYGKMCETYAIGVGVKSSYLGNTYASLAGTSMAAPFVSAAVTYMILDNPDTTYQSAVDTIEKFEYNNGMHIEYIFDEGIPQLPAPTFSVEEGEYDDEFYLELSCRFEGASIHYNLSTFGSDTYYQTYSQPIKIKYDTVVTAYATRIGNINSEKSIATYTRIFPDDEDKYVINASGYITEYLGPTSDDDSILVIPDTIDGIAPIGIARETFANFTFLESIIFPESIKKVEIQAFTNCTNLKYVRAPGLTYINTAAFDGCKNLKEFDAINLTHIDSYAFAGCESLQFLYLRNATYIGGYAFDGAGGVQVVELDNIETIKENAFYNSNVREAIIPHAITISSRAFKNCTSLEEISIPLAIELQGECFYDCTVLKEVNAASLTTLTNRNFSNCTSLEQINLPSLVISGNDTSDFNFYGCTALKTFVAPKLLSIGASCFSGCTALETVTTPLLEITGNYAFRNCTSLKSINVPKLSTVGSYCFENCTNLEAITAPLLHTLNSYAFQNCTSLKEIDCSNVVVINEDVFAGCTSLKELYFKKGITVPENTFKSSFTAEKVVFDVPLMLSDVPSGIPVTISSSVKTINSSNTENIIIYGSKGSYAETWATENGHTFIEITPETAIFQDIASYCKNYSQELYFNVIGFKRTYQWYGTNTKSTTDGTAIKGAKSSRFVPADYDTSFNYYYCVATSKDGTNEKIYITSSICSFTPIIPQGNTTIDFEKLILYTSDTEKNLFSDIVTFGEKVKFRTVSSYASKTTDYFGTGSYVVVYVNGVPNTTFNLVVYGDINGDSICNVLDCFEAEKTANGHTELTDVYSLAADTDQNGVINVTDYQDIVNRAMKQA